METSIEKANDFLKQALSELASHIDVNLLKKQLDQGLFESLQVFLAPYAFTMPPKMDDPLPKAIANSLSMIGLVKMLLTESQT